MYPSLETARRLGGTQTCPGHRCVDNDASCSGQDHSQLTMNITEFKAFTNWRNHFMNRHQLSVHRYTHISQKLPNDHEEQLMRFQRFLIETRKRLDLPPPPPLFLIRNADQSPISFDLHSETIIHVTGTSMINIKNHWPRKK